MDSMSALGLSVNEADSFIDKMAKTSQKSNTSVSQLGEAILTAGGTAKNLAGGTTELNAALGILADNGIKGAEGGTALRNVILALTPSTDKAKKAFKDLNVETYDANGKLKPLEQTFGEMNEQLKTMSQEDRTRVLSDIFNKVDLKSVNGLLAASTVNMGDLRNELAGMGVDTEATADTMNYLASTFEKGEDKASFMSYAMEEMGINTEQASAMYDYLNENIEGSSTRFDELTGYIEDSEGAASSMAETMNSGLNGSLTELKSGLEGMGIAIGTALIPVIEKLVEWIQNAVTWFNGLDEGTQTTVAMMGLLVAAIGPVLMVMGSLIKACGIVGGALGALSGVAIPLLIGALALIAAKVGDSSQSLLWLQDQFGSLGTVIGGVCEFISGIWTATFEQLFNVAKLGMDLIAAVIDGPGGATVKDAWQRYNDETVRLQEEAADKLTLTTTRGLSKMRHASDKELSECVTAMEGVLSQVPAIADGAYLGAANNIAQQLQGMDNNQINILQSMNDTTRMMFQDINDGMDVQEATNQIVTNLELMASNGKLNVDTLEKDVSAAMQTMSRNAEAEAKNTSDAIVTETEKAKTQGSNNVKDLAKETGNQTSTMSKEAEKNAKAMAKAMGDNAKKGSDDLSKGMQQASKVVFDESGKIPKDVDSNMQASVRSMRQAGSDIYNGMNTSFSKLASQGKQHFTDLYNGTTRSSSKMASQVIADWNRIRSALSGTITGNVQIKVHGVQAALNQINSVKNAANRSSFMGDSMANPSLDNIMLLDEVGSMLRSDSMASYVANGTSSTLDVNVKSSKNDKKSLGDIKVDINIDKFENKTNDSPIEFADKVIDRVVYKLKRERIAIGGA